MDPLAAIVILSISGPVIGSIIGVLKRPSYTYICNMLSFAAGVMLAISFLELIPQSMEFAPLWVCILGLLIGASFMFGLDLLLPHIHPQLCSQEQGRSLERTSIYLIVGIFLHNFPEGMAIAIGSVTDFKVSMSIALAIAVHNIPEGICTSAPYFHASGHRLKAFLLSSSTAIPILIGFILARWLFQSISPQIIGFIIGATAGLMIYITADELIPQSCTGSDHRTIFSLIFGVIFVLILGIR